MIQKLGNWQGRQLRRQAAQWEDHPARMLIMYIGVQVALAALRDINKNRAKKAVAPLRKKVASSPRVRKVKDLSSEEEERVEKLINAIFKKD